MQKKSYIDYMYILNILMLFVSLLGGLHHRVHAQSAPVFTTIASQMDSIAHAGVLYRDTIEAQDADVGDSFCIHLV